MNSDQTAKRLIEVALPIREISAESVRDKSLRHGHISTLHLWWARRPLAAARAVVFASLVFDPDDPNCPEEFLKEINRLLKTHVPPELKFYQRGRRKIPDNDPYRPYDGMPDTPRNRLLMFIAKWSPESIEFESGKSGKQPDPKYILDDRSLVKWETSDPENEQGKKILGIACSLVRSVYGGNVPTVLDPFAGGGAIPLEASRLGCEAIANDYNPVAYLILRATCEFPQKYGKPGKRQVTPEESGKFLQQEKEVPNILAYDVKRWAKKILQQAKEKIGHLYPDGNDGKAVVAYLWARTAPCSNPSCKAEIPLLRSLIVCNKSGKKVALTMHVDKARREINFGIAKNNAVSTTAGTMQSRGNVKCPFCEQITPVADLRRAGLSGNMKERMVAVIVEGENGKDYRPVEKADTDAFQEALKIEVERPAEYILPEINSDTSEDDVSNSTGIRVHLYGMTTWGSLFNHRQLVAMQTFVECLREVLHQIDKEVSDPQYSKALSTYMGLWVSRIAQRGSNVGIWHTSRETLEHPFGRQAIPMTWDYPEANPFSESTGGAEGGIDWVARVITHESAGGSPAKVTLGDAASISLEKVSIDLVTTDPPYFDAIAYADLSDYFYVWLKRTLSDIFPEILATPLTPKADEATALKHRHAGSEEKADDHFKDKLSSVLSQCLKILKPGGMISIMFAHQSTKAWSTLIKAILKAGLTIDATWPIDTELTSALKSSMSALSSSVTVACSPRVTSRTAQFRDIKKEIDMAVADSLKRFWSYGIRGADLVVACYGPAVGVFGKYERVEKADGTPVEIPELLELARIAAQRAIAGEFRGDTLSTLYYVWANIYGISEQAWDDARLVLQVGGDEASTMEIARREEIFVIDGSKCRLAALNDRRERRNLGGDESAPLIDALHRAMLYWKQENRADLVAYLSQRGLLEDGPLWKLAQALFEVLPRDIEDWKLVSALLNERPTLMAEGKKAVPEKLQMTFEVK